MRAEVVVVSKVSLKHKLTNSLALNELFRVTWATIGNTSKALIVRVGPSTYLMTGVLSIGWHAVTEFNFSLWSTFTQRDFLLTEHSDALYCATLSRWQQVGYRVNRKYFSDFISIYHTDVLMFLSAFIGIFSNPHRTAFSLQYLTNAFVANFLMRKFMKRTIPYNILRKFYFNKEWLDSVNKYCIRRRQQCAC